MRLPEMSLFGHVFSTARQHVVGRLLTGTRLLRDDLRARLFVQARTLGREFGIHSKPAAVVGIDPVSTCTPPRIDLFVPNGGCATIRKGRGVRR